MLAGIHVSVNHTVCKVTHFSECAVNVHRKVFKVVSSSLSVNKVTSNSSLPLHVCDVPVPANLLCHVHKVSPPIPLSAHLATLSRLHALIKKFPHFHQQLMIAPRNSVF